MYKDPLPLSRLFRVRPFIEKEGKFYFVHTAVLPDEIQDSTERLKAFFKRWPRLYRLARSLVSASFDEGMDVREAIEAALGGEAPQGKIILNLGSGVEDLGPEVINADRRPFRPVQVVADAADLPFKDASVDILVTESLLEHCREPERVVAEIARVVKPGGFLFCSVPFLYPFHASPDDYTRFTLAGLTDRLREFEPIRSGVQAGPMSAVAVQLAYIFALLLSFGSSRLYGSLTAIFIAILSPLKVLNFLLRPFARREDAAAALYFFGKRRDKNL